MDIQTRLTNEIPDEVVEERHLSKKDFLKW